MTNEELRQLSVKRSWFTEDGSHEDSRLYVLNENGASVHDLALAIWLLSQSTDSVEDIESVLHGEIFELMLTRARGKRRVAAMGFEGIVIEGYSGTWHPIEKNGDENCEPIYLLESEQDGEDAAMLIVDEYGKVLMDEVYNGFDDYWEAAK